MRLLTVRDLVNSAADKWRSVYGNMPANWRLANGENPHEILARLDKLDVSQATPEQVLDTIYGASPEDSRCKGWAYPQCSECKEYVEKAVVFDEDEDGQRRFCNQCLRKAMSLAWEEEKDDCAYCGKKQI